jgi:tetratricopeptide (TPR) repeat protein
MVGLLGVGLTIAGALLHTARLAAEIGRTEQQKQRAVAHYREARETLRRLLARGEPANWRPTTHPSEIYLAQIEEALTFYRSALQSDGTDPEVTRDMANAHLTAATAQSLRGESHRAKANLQSACALLEPLHASDPDDLLTCRFLAICYNALALTEPSPDAAIELRRKTLALCDRLMEVDVVDPYRARAVAEAVHNLGASLQAAGRLAEAETQYVRSIALWRDIRSASTDIYTTMSLAESQINLAVLLQQLPGRVDEVLTLYRNADGLLLPIVDDRTQGVEVATSLAIAYLNWSNVYSFTGRSSEATELLTRAIALLDKALVREPKWAAARENRAKVYGGRAQIYSNRGQFKEALADWDRAAADATSADMRKTVHLFRAGVLIRLGDHAAAAGAAAELADSPNLTGADQYNLACTFALCIPPALADRSFEEAERSRRADDYAQQALRRLEAAREAGYFRDPRAVSHLAADADLEPLHFRPGWREFELTLPNGSPPKGRSSSDG